VFIKPGAATQSRVRRCSSLGERCHSVCPFHLPRLLTVLGDFHRELYPFGVLLSFFTRDKVDMNFKAYGGSNFAEKFLEPLGREINYLSLRLRSPSLYIERPLSHGSPLLESYNDAPSNQHITLSFFFVIHFPL
jgi:hypothetical protein